MSCSSGRFPASNEHRQGVALLFCLYLACLLAATPAQAMNSSLAGCRKKNVELDWPAQHRLFTLSGRVEKLLAASGRNAVLISRSGTDLARFGLHYSHTGVASRDNPLAAWGVTQLFYDCDAARSFLFDQGLTDFVAEQHDGNIRLSLVFLSPARALQLRSYP